MPDNILSNEDVTEVPNTSTMTRLTMPQAKQQKTVQDWVRDMRMSADVNNTTLGVATDRVTPDLLLATSKKLIKLNRHEVEPDAKDSLEFQRVYSADDYFAEHILRDADKLGRNLLWKASNKGNLDFMPTAALDQHVSSVFNNSKLANMIDGSSPLETVDASYKITRIGEGGVQDVESAPDEMRLIQPSFLGYIDPVRCFSADTDLMTSKGWKNIASITEQDELACLYQGQTIYAHPSSMHSYAYNGKLCFYEGKHFSYQVTENHRMFVAPVNKAKSKINLEDYKIVPASECHTNAFTVCVGSGQPMAFPNNTAPATIHLPATDTSSTMAELNEDFFNISLEDMATIIALYLPSLYMVRVGIPPYSYYEICSATANDGAVIDECTRHINNIISKYRLEIPSNIPTQVVSEFRRRLDAFLLSLGNVEDRHVPEWIFTAPVAVRFQFLLHLDYFGLRSEFKIYSSQLLKDITKLQFEMGLATYAWKTQPTRKHPDRWNVKLMRSTQKLIRPFGRDDNGKCYSLIHYEGQVYCPTVPGGLVYARRGDGNYGFWVGNSPESLRVGLDAYLTKHCMRGTDGKLYQTFINAHTGKPELVDSVTAAKSIVTTPDMMETKTDHCYAVGGKTGVRIVNKKDVDYYLPHMDDAFSTAANLVTGMSGVKEMRLLMGCLHPLSNVLVMSRKNEIDIIPAKDVNTACFSVPGVDANGQTQCYPIRTTVAKMPWNKSWFRKIVLYSGRTLTTSMDHKWPVLKDDKLVMVPAEQLKPDDVVLRSTFKHLQGRRMFFSSSQEGTPEALKAIQINKDIGILLGYVTRSLSLRDDKDCFIEYAKCHEQNLKDALEKLNIQGSKFYTYSKKYCIGFQNSWFTDWVKHYIGLDETARRIPSLILSASLDVVAEFINAYTMNENKVGMDSAEYVWILDIPNYTLRDGLAFLLSRIGTDTLYRDGTGNAGEHSIALKLVETPETFGNCVKDCIKSVTVPRNAPIMVDIDINNNLYALANGIVTHNSKYPLQAVSIEGREPPLVRGLDEASGKDIHSIIGRYLGARYATKPGTVTSVRKDRIDMLYDDGTKGSVAMYQNFPMNAKGYINNTPQVTAGMHVDKDGLLASSNYTDDKGVAATGVNLRSAWISWKGGTYEDAIVISESAAKKLTSTTMYSKDLDLDKTVTLGKNNYLSWKPDEFTSDQLDLLDNDGIARPGKLLHKGDPMVLAVRTTEPSPGTMGKRILTDVSETWEHANPGLVTDIIRTRNGVKVLATVTAPAEVDDKISGLYGNKGTISDILPNEMMPQDTPKEYRISKILPDEQMPRDKNGGPFEVLLSPLGVISRCNPAQLTEALLGKVAHLTGKPEIIPAFYKGNIQEYVLNKLKQQGLTAEDSLYDPDTGREIPEVTNGYSYMHKLKHLAESKMSARGTDEYSSDETPGGSGYSGSKRFGMLEQSAMAGHGAFDNLLDNKLIRGQSNADFWRSIRTGGIPTIPGEPLVQRKFFAHLQGAGVNVRKTPKGISVFALSNSDVNELAGPRELKSRDTYEAKNFRPLDGGLFGQDVFGLNGDKWGYIQLDEPMPNPVMEDPLARLLRMPDKDFKAVVTGQATINDMSNTTDMKEKLSHINLKDEATRALDEFKNAPASRKDNALKRYIAIENMHRAGLNPSEYMLDKLPVLPPQYRPISSHNGLTMVADANYLYAQLLDARDDMREAKSLPQEYQATSRKNLYRTWQELVGMYDPEDVKLRNKNVGGLLKWALGNRPKCYDDETEVLTERGWMPFKDYEGQSAIAVLDGHGTISYEAPSDIIHQHVDAPMLYVDSPIANSMVTLNHNHYAVMTSLLEQGFHKVSAEAMLKSFQPWRMCVAGGTFSQADDNTDRLTGILIALYLQFGSLDDYAVELDFPIDNPAHEYCTCFLNILGLDYSHKTRTTHSETLYSRNGRPIEETVVWDHYTINDITIYKWIVTNLGETHKKLPEDFRTWTPQFASSVFQPLILMGCYKCNPDALRKKKFHLEAVARHAKDGSETTMPLEAPILNIQEFLASTQLMHQSHTKANEDTVYIEVRPSRRTDDLDVPLSDLELMSTCSDELCDNLQEVAVKIGLMIYAVKNPLVDMEHNFARTLYLHRQDYVQVSAESMHEVAYNGMVHCVTVPSGLIVTRRQGRVLISGNSSAFQRKVLGGTVDTVGRGAIMPNAKLNVDEIGIPVDMAFDIMAPFVERGLVRQGYTPIAAMKMVKKHDPHALDELERVAATHPVEMNRAPTLHKYGIMAFMPKLVQGHGIQVHPSVCPGFGADFDGDTVANSTRIVIELEKLEEKVKNNGIDSLNSLEYGIYYSHVQNQGNDLIPSMPEEAVQEDSIEMISNNTKCLFATATGSLSELPVVLNSEVKKSDTVTEWDVQDGFYTDTIDPATGTHELARITKVSKHTDLKMYDCVISVNGKYQHICTASEDHSLITFNPTTMELEKSTPMNSVGRLVPRVLYNGGNDNNVCTRYIHIGQAIPATWELGFFLGVMIGDGWVDAGNVPRLACCYKPLQEYLSDLLSVKNSPIPLLKDSDLWSYNIKENNGRFSRNPQQRFTLHMAKEIRLALKQLIGTGAYNKRIPEDCLMASRAHMVGILMGLLASDGTVSYAINTKAKKSPAKTIMISTISPYLRDNIQELCIRLGIRTGATPYKGPHSISTCYAVTISVRDIAREYERTPSLFNTHHTDKQNALMKIIAEAGKVQGKQTDYSIVPFPEILRGEMTFSGISVQFADVYAESIKSGSVGLTTARKIAGILKETDWTHYVESNNIQLKYRHKHTSAQAKELVNKWITLVNTPEIAWEKITSVTPASCTEGWDCTVPGPYTFTLSTGTVVQDTVNIHVPVSDNARKEALARMRPSRNLIALSDRKIMYKPEKEYMQGLYIASRMGEAPAGRAQIFKTMTEAKQAYRSGVIDVDTPIQILDPKG